MPGTHLPEPQEVPQGASLGALSANRDVGRGFGREGFCVRHRIINCPGHLRPTLQGGLQFPHYQLPQVGAFSKKSICSILAPRCSGITYSIASEQSGIQASVPVRCMDHRAVPGDLRNWSWASRDPKHA